MITPLFGLAATGLYTPQYSYFVRCFMRSCKVRGFDIAVNIRNAWEAKFELCQFLNNTTGAIYADQTTLPRNVYWSTTIQYSATTR